MSGFQSEFDPVYIRLTANKSRCAECGNRPTLIQAYDPKPEYPMFYICWTCKRVTQAGVGIVEEEK